ncbi:hypothetical protein [Azospirillum doebereinerae]
MFKSFVRIVKFSKLFIYEIPPFSAGSGCATAKPKFLPVPAHRRQAKSALTYYSMSQQRRFYGQMYHR